MATNTLDAHTTRTDGRSTNPWRPSARTRKTVLVVHILSAGAWVGIDLIVGVLVLTGWLTASVSVQAVAYQALGLFVVWPMFVSGLVCLTSGVLLGLGSRYGLLRYWWVAVKLVMNVVLCALVMVLLRPGLADVLRHGRTLAAGRSSDLDVSFLFFPPAVSLAALSIATVLAVFKPWGRTGRTVSRR